ncbi:MAG: adenine phosphoribosyltransferase [Candidatus Helarchaeota archaeon]|nr:adenine phosphoribosyltransferase [Candidatus Helarchaeota archaeon]
MRKTHLDEIYNRIRAIDMLKILKKRYTYDHLAKLTNLPITVLNRYVKGHVLPSAERANELLKIFKKKFDVKKEINDRIKFDKNGYFNNTDLVCDILLLRLIANMLAIKYQDQKITKILTVATDGIPLSTYVAGELGVNLALAKKNREAGVSKFYEEDYSHRTSGVIQTLYIPKSELTSKDHVLIVDDIIRSGVTQGALVKLVKKSGANLVGIFSIVSIGKNWQKEIKAVTESIPDILVNVKEPELG